MGIGAGVWGMGGQRTDGAVGPVKGLLLGHVVSLPAASSFHPGNAGAQETGIWRISLHLQEN